MQLIATAVNQRQPHVEVHQQDTVAQVRANNGTPVRNMDLLILSNMVYEMIGSMFKIQRI